MASDTLEYMEDETAAEPLVRRLEQLGPVSDQDRRLLRDGAFTVRQVSAHHDLLREGDRPLHCPLLLDGFACQHKTLEDGRRQIVAFHLPTDLCDLAGSLLLGKLDHGITTLTPARVAFIPNTTLLGWAALLPGLGLLLWRHTLVDAAASRAWVVNLGRRSAAQRTAHLLCELALRLRRAGLAQGASCALPLTQLMLADALGLTPVHVNRTLQGLRGEGLVEFGGGTLTVRNWSALVRAADFDPAYLQ